MGVADCLTLDPIDLRMGVRVKPCSGDLSQHPWGLIDNELAAIGLRQPPRLGLQHCHSVLHAVASSDLVACIQESVVKRFGKGLNLLSCATPFGLPPFALSMVWHRQRNDDPAQSWLRKLIVAELGLRTAGNPLVPE